MPQAIARVSLMERAAEYVGRAAGALYAGVKVGTYDTAVRAQFESKDRPFSPMAPLETSVTHGAPPRSFEVGQGRNIAYIPRREDGRLTPFASLRSLADSHSITRAVIQNIKSLLTSMSWEIGTTDEARDAAESKEAEILALRQFLRTPDRNVPWSAWLSSVLEELLVVDAVTLVPTTDRARRPLALRLLDGSTIKPLVDVLGQAPLPPAPAYQQILYGRPETEFTTDEILYRPKNRRTWTPYGQSPLEMIAVTLNLAIRRELHYLNFYTSGNLPDALYMVPSTWTDTQIAKYQTWFDDLMSGDSGRRAGHIHFVPGGEGAGYQATKDEEWKYEFDEYLARIVAWAFGVSPLPIAKMVNRASSEQMDRSHQAAGIDPICEYIKLLIDEYLQRWCDLPWAEFKWADERSADRFRQLQEDEWLVRNGIRTIDEVRQDRGMPPLPDGAGEKPWILAGATVLLVEDVMAGKGAPQAAEGGGAAPGGPGAKGPSDGAPAGGEMARLDLSRWRRIALKDFKRGGPGTVRKFRSEHLDPATLRKTHGLLKAASDPAAIEGIFADLRKRARGASGALRRAQAERAATKAILRAFGKAKPAIVAGAEDHRRRAHPLKVSRGTLRKDEGAAWDELGGALEVILGDAAAAGAMSATSAVGLDFETPPQEALNYARERSAELIGRQWVAGKLVDNPNSEWAITDTIRQDVQKIVNEAIEEGWSSADLADALELMFSPARAEMIARTETAIAYNQGAAKAYKQEGVERLRILDGEGCLPDGHDDSAGEPDDEDGVQEDAQADGQIWTPDEYSGLPVGHPNCARAAAPIIETDMPDDDEEGLR